MARKMKKFSAGGAQGRYDRRMADIEKDYAKAMARKTGKAAEVAEAKRQQRIADAKDDLAKRTGGDRTATRAAEKLAESNLTKTRKYGAPKAVTTEASVSQPKITDTLGALTAPKSGLATADKKPEVKKTATPVKADTAPKRMGDQGAAYKSKTTGGRPAMAAIRENAPTHYRYVRGGSNSGAAADGTAAKRLEAKGLKTGDSKTGTGNGTSRLARAADPKDKSAAASRARGMAALSYLNPFSYLENRARRQDPSEVNKAKGGKVKKKGTTMKYAKGGSTSANKKPMPKEPITGGANTVPLTPERKEFLKELAKRNAKPGMAKGGKAATKFGKAMVKKSADTKGRAMVKKAGGGKCYASGGLVAGHKSADGIAVRGKTKTSMTKMKKGGKC